MPTYYCELVTGWSGWIPLRLLNTIKILCLQRQPIFVFSLLFLLETLSKVNSSNLPWSNVADDVDNDDVDNDGIDNDGVDNDDVDNDDEEEEWKVKQHNYIALILLVLLSDKNHGNPHSE